MNRTSSKFRVAPTPVSVVNKWGQRRMYATAIVILLLFLGLGYKAYDLQISQGDKYLQWARRQHMRTLKVPAPRGVIYDAKGQELAVTIDVDSVYANPEQVDNVRATAESIGTILNMDLRQLELRLASTRGFVWIKRHLQAEHAKRLKELALPGIGFRREPRRFYPMRSLASTVIGVVGVDNRGLDGIELSQNDLLAGRRVELPAVRDAAGRVMLFERAPDIVAGSSIKLTIDSQIQFIVERALERAAEKHQPKSGTAIVMDMEGGVLAMANWPSYDPNTPFRSREVGARNYATTDTYEIGSIMKVFTVAAALDIGVVKPDTTINVEHGRYRIGRKIIRDTYKDWELDVGGVLKRSSNVGAVKIAQKLGASSLYKALRRYGFGKKTGMEIPGERAGFVRDPDRWGVSGLVAASFGYDLTATALQVVAAMAAIGSQGIYYPPRVIQEVYNASGELEYRRTPNGHRIMKQRTALQLQKMLALVFEKGKYGGTARKVEVQGYQAGGKTGTAHKVYHGKYSNTHYLSSFAGLAPIESPQIAVLVIIDEPTGGEYYGSSVAAPAFAEIASQTLRYLLVPNSSAQIHQPQPSEEEEGRKQPIPGKDIAPIAYAPLMQPIPGDIREALDPVAKQETWVVPNFIGLGIGRAVALAAQSGTSLEIEGTGRAIAQHPLPGLAVKPRQCRVLFAHVEE